MEKLKDEKIENLYHAMVTERIGSEFGKCWGFHIRPERYRVYTIEVALEILDFANKKYEEIFNEPADFNYLVVEMNGKEKKVKYWKDRNRLLISKDGFPIYENNNGIICRDQEALADCLGDGLD